MEAENERCYGKVLDAICHQLIFACDLLEDKFTKVYFKHSESCKIRVWTLLPSLLTGAHKKVSRVEQKFDHICIYILLLLQ